MYEVCVYAFLSVYFTFLWFSHFQGGYSLCVNFVHVNKFHDINTIYAGENYAFIAIDIILLL